MNTMSEKSPVTMNVIAQLSLHVTFLAHCTLTIQFTPAHLVDTRIQESGRSKDVGNYLLSFNKIALMYVILCRQIPRYYEINA